ncbi:ArgS-related anticodon-binding protein NrtL [Streptomyces sp. Go-475]|uniref:ArgS-related anticodon-binding protein NrtL n=1 Tax=Streptomyces sp. Go-475 TaxID=2072505 RepID=UPI000DEF212B|nr:DALR anticodon-binding domain-containing protein [Streptomyces sp. Go-475]AXE88637.1 Arginine--tRNA ligase [Streptomyces sp. Go-475]
MTPVELSRTVLHAVRRAVDEGELSVTVPERAVVTPPGPGGCGDYATNIALQLAGAAGQPPRRVAEILRARLLHEHCVTDVVVTGPGFLNLSLESTASADLVEEILRRGRRYGHAVGFSGNIVQLRCPAEVRAVVVADAIARVRRSQGDVVRVHHDGPPAPEWESVLGVDIDDSHGPRALADVDLTVRPVPAPADPLPLGRDAARWALLYPAAHDRPRITPEHLVQRETNPLFRVRYAHARTRALLRNAADLGFHPEPGPVGGGDALVALLGDHPRVLATAQDTPDRLARHLLAVADAALPLFPAVLPLGEEKPSAAHRARLALAEAAGTVLAGGLSLLGIDAPDHL